MKKSLVLAMAMALGVTASAYAANPFSDVPAGHWAYDAVNKLAAEGVVDGYPDGTYGGDKLMTRYEMAQIVAKAMAKGANVDKLAAEFADELDSLGVRVANLEKKADNVKITGEIRYHYTDDSDDFEGYGTKLRTRLWVNGQINEDWSYTGMIQNEQNFKNDAGDEDVDFQRAYVNGKIGGVKVQAGRYNLNLVDGNVYDNRFDGVQASYGKDVNLKVGYGKATPSGVSYVQIPKYQGMDNGSGIARESDEVYYAELSGKISKLGLTAGYYSFADVTDYKPKKDDGSRDIYGQDDFNIWALTADYAFDDNVKLAATYLKGEDEFAGYEWADNTVTDISDNSYVVKLSYKGAKASEPGSWGLAARYYDMGMTSYLDHTMNGKADSMHGFKGYSVFANYTFAKNIVGQVEWYDLEEKDNGLDRNAQTLWAQMLFTF